MRMDFKYLFLLFLLSSCDRKDDSNASIKITSKIIKVDTMNKTWVISATLVNQSEEEISFWEYTCAKECNWALSEKSFLIMPTNCDKNILKLQTLSPKDSIRYLFILKNKNEDRFVKKKLRLGFYYISDKNSSDSAEKILQSRRPSDCFYSNDVVVEGF